MNEDRNEEKNHNVKVETEVDRVPPKPAIPNHSDRGSWAWVTDPGGRDFESGSARPAIL